MTGTDRNGKSSLTDRYGLRSRLVRFHAAPSSVPVSTASNTRGGGVRRGVAVGHGAAVVQSSGPEMWLSAPDGPGAVSASRQLETAPLPARPLPCRHAAFMPSRRAVAVR